MSDQFPFANQICGDVLWFGEPVLKALIHQRALRSVYYSILVIIVLHERAVIRLINPDVVALFITRVHTAALEVARDNSDALALAVGGGEDYELCITVRPGVMQRIESQFEAYFALSLTLTGHVMQGSGVEFVGGSGIVPPLGGYTHFG